MSFSIYRCGRDWFVIGLKIKVLNPYDISQNSWISRCFTPEHHLFPDIDSGHVQDEMDWEMTEVQMKKYGILSRPYTARDYWNDETVESVRWTRVTIASSILSQSNPVHFWESSGNRRPAQDMSHEFVIGHPDAVGSSVSECHEKAHASRKENSVLIMPHSGREPEVHRVSGHTAGRCQKWLGFYSE
jgi:hypothetical protein